MRIQVDLIGLGLIFFGAYFLISDLLKIGIILLVVGVILQFYQQYARKEGD